MRAAMEQERDNHRNAQKALEVRGVWVGYCVGLAMVTALLLWRLEQVIARGVTRAEVAEAEA